MSDDNSGQGSGKRQIKISVFVNSAGHHPAAWRQAETQRDANVDFDYWASLARTAERGLCDALFIADGVAMPGDNAPYLARLGPFGIGIEPLTLLSGLATVTKHIGLISTASTTYNDPYNIARAFASLDHLSKGRAGWNVVTTQGDAAAVQFGLSHNPDHATRYERAEEFLEVAKGLWDTWDDDAFSGADHQAGQFFDPNGFHLLEHSGKHFQVRGPLNVPRPPQGYPLIVQAGASDAGRELAAKSAEMIYTPAQSIDLAQRYYADVKGRMAAYGREPEHLLITPGIFPVVGRTHDEAVEKYELLQAELDPQVGLRILSTFAGGFDLSDYPVDGPLPDLPDTEEGKGRAKLLTEVARRENLTLRQLYLRFAVVRGHRLILGTASEIADELEEWFTSDAADGFNLVPPFLPSGLTDFVDRVIPELQRRGLYRTAYEGVTLRDRLGLPRPANRHVSRRSAALV